MESKQGAQPTEDNESVRHQGSILKLKCWLFIFYPDCWIILHRKRIFYDTWIWQLLIEAVPSVSCQMWSSWGTSEMRRRMSDIWSTSPMSHIEINMLQSVDQVFQLWSNFFSVFIGSVFCAQWNNCGKQTVFAKKIYFKKETSILFKNIWW